MHPQLRGIVNRLKTQYAQENPATPAAVQTSAPKLELRQQLQRDIVNAGIKNEVTPLELGEACDELGVDYHLFTEEFVTWL